MLANIDVLDNTVVISLHIVRMVNRLNGVGASDRLQGRSSSGLDNWLEGAVGGVVERTLHLPSQVCHDTVESTKPNTRR